MDEVAAQQTDERAPARKSFVRRTRRNPGGRLQREMAEAMARDENETLAIAHMAARILGPQCAAALALARREELQAAGHDTHILLLGNTWLVKEPSQPVD